ncbi:MAG: septum formation family protein [Pseudoclavibacter sp.]|nr:septum formation family protein [Pseudoclavibacter sp.]
MTNPPLRRLCASAVAVIGALALSGCTLITTLQAEGEPTPEPTASTSETPVGASGSPSPTTPPTSSSTASPTLAPSSVPGTTTNYLDLNVGDCFDHSSQSGFAEVYPDCSTLHLYEVFAALQVPGDTFPGDAGLRDFADQNCPAEFARYVGVPITSSTFGYAIIFPSEGTWSEGDREVLCSAVSADNQPVAGSVRGSKR